MPEMTHKPRRNPVKPEETGINPEITHNCPQMPKKTL
jgi:hypothetical protein